MTDTSKQLLVAAIKRVEALERVERFDGAVPESKPTPAQQEVLDALGVVPIRYVRAANQGGKTQTGARECAWVFEENHPRWKRPAAWGNEPLLMVIACMTLKQFEEVIWRKLKMLLDPGCYHVKRSTAGIEKITNLRNGNEILVLSYHNTGDAQDKLQGFVGHWAWVDEMPYSASIFEEIIRRVASRSGSFLATFTPKVRNDSIRRMVDSAMEPYARVYRFRMFDNPLYASPEKQAEELGKMAGLPDHVKKTVLEGEWTSGDSAVYYFNYDEMAKHPTGYSHSWEHVVAVDPANNSDTGVVVFARDPETGKWYIIKATTFGGVFFPDKIVLEVEKIVLGLNVVKRVYDPAACWFFYAASALGIRYEGIYNKKERKNDLIKNLQTFLAGNYVSPLCSEFIDELTGCSWSETAADKIVGAQKLHLLDAAQYGVDRLPAFKPALKAADWMTRLIAADDKRIRQEQKAASISHGGRIGRRRVW